RRIRVIWLPRERNTRSTPGTAPGLVRLEVETVGGDRVAGTCERTERGERDERGVGGIEGDAAGGRAGDHEGAGFGRSEEHGLAHAGRGGRRLGVRAHRLRR